MASQDNNDIVFGISDGLTSSAGVVAGTISSHDPKLIIGALVGLAIAEAFGMASGEYLSSSSKRRAAIIGLATGLTCFAPIAAVAIFGANVWAVGYVLFALVLFAAWLQGNKLRNYVQTIGLLGIVALVTVLVTRYL